MSAVEKHNEFDDIQERYLSKLSLGLDDVVADAKMKLYDSETELIKRRIEYLPQEQVGMLRDMTDGVLEQAGFDLSEGSPAPVVIFTARMDRKRQQREGYDLKVYSVADGIAGFNTFHTPGIGQDVSRRWVIYTDRGARLGGAFDYKGTVYQRGRHEKSDLRENITTPLTEIIPNAYRNHVGPIEFKLAPELGTRTA